MKKEEILEKSRNENKKKDAYELEVSYKGGTMAAILMVILASVYYCYEIFTAKGSNPAFYSLITVYNAAFFGYKAIKLEKSRKLNIFTSVIWGIMSIMLIVMYFTLYNK